MKTKYLKVLNKIKSITTNDIVFECENDRIVFLRKKFQNKIQWKIAKDGVFVDKNLIDNYYLETEN